MRVLRKTKKQKEQIVNDAMEKIEHLNEKIAECDEKMKIVIHSKKLFAEKKAYYKNLILKNL